MRDDDEEYERAGDVKEIGKEIGKNLHISRVIKRFSTKYWQKFTKNDQFFRFSVDFSTSKSTFSQIFAIFLSQFPSTLLLKVINTIAICDTYAN